MISNLVQLEQNYIHKMAINTIANMASWTKDTRPLQRNKLFNKKTKQKKTAIDKKRIFVVNDTLSGRLFVRGENGSSVRQKLWKVYAQ